MSRTDKTAPSRVKMFYYPDWIEEYHDHRHGECDLPPRPRNPKDEGLEYWYGGTRHNKETHCYWVASYTNYYTHGLAQCGCSICGRDAYESMPRRKRQRIEGRNYCRNGWEKEY